RPLSRQAQALERVRAEHEAKKQIGAGCAPARSPWATATPPVRKSRGCRVAWEVLGQLLGPHSIEIFIPLAIVPPRYDLLFCKKCSRNLMIGCGTTVPLRYSLSGLARY